MAEGDKQPGSTDKSPPPTQEPVWSYRGYNLRSSEFTTAMVHYYRYYELWSLRARLIETDFFVVTPAQEVLGRGFQPLAADGGAPA